MSSNRWPVAWIRLSAYSPVFWSSFFSFFISLWKSLIPATIMSWTVTLTTFAHMSSCCGCGDGKKATTVRETKEWERINHAEKIKKHIFFCILYFVFVLKIGAFTPVIIEKTLRKKTKWNERKMTNSMTKASESQSANKNDITVRPEQQKRRAELNWTSLNQTSL